MSDIDVRALYAEVEERLDMDYVRDVARGIATAMRGRGEALGVAFQPGDATRYDLLFVPIQGLRNAPARLVEGKLWDESADFGIERVSGTVLVAYEQQGRCGGLDLRWGGLEPFYLSEIFGTGLASACTLALLFNAVAEPWNA